MKSFVFLALLTLVSSESAFGFINIEVLRIQPVEGYSGSVDLSGQLQNGNTDKSILNFSSLNRIHDGKNEYLAVANYRYGETFKLKDTHRGSAHLRYARYLNDDFAGETFVQSAFDEFRALTRRDLVGLSARKRVMKEDGFFMFFGSGFFYENEQIKIDPNEEDLRGNFYLSSVYDGELPIRVALVTYYQPLWNQLNDYRLNLDLNTESPIYKKLSLILTVNYQFDSRPPSTVKKYDTLSLVGVRWSTE